MSVRISACSNKIVTPRATEYENAEKEKNVPEKMRKKRILGGSIIWNQYALKPLWSFFFIAKKTKKKQKDKYNIPQLSRKLFERHAKTTWTVAIQS